MEGKRPKPEADSEERKRIQFLTENFERLCRLCLTNEQLVNLYSNVQGRNVFYVRNFVKDSLRALEHTINKKDGLPNFICEKCERNLNIIFNFKKKCDHSRRVLEKIRSKTIQPEDLRLAEELGGEQPVEKIKETTTVSYKTRSKKGITDSSCEELLRKLPQTINVKNVKEDVKADIVSVLNSSTVKHGTKLTSQESAQELLVEVSTAMNFEIDELEKDDKISISVSVPEIKPMVVTIEKANLEEPSLNPEEYLEERGGTDSDSDWVPNEGNKKVIIKTSKVESKPPDPKVAEIKRQPPKREKASPKQKKKKHANEKTVCSICGALVNNMKCHLVIHAEVRPHQCEQCPKNFTSRNKLQSHINSVHLRKRDYKCEICGKAFLEKNNLKGHLRIHNGERKYECDMCPKKFLFAGTLRYHKLTHTQDKQHECQVCGKLFLLRTTLTKHLLVHGDERPYKCEICDKGFRTSTHRMVHMRTHTGEKPLRCRICGLGFAHHKARSTHMKSTHAQELIARDMLDEKGHLKF
ncbi:zinc finger protein 691 [Uranotaenia lowii]|uniref:zinc finger protein 691 n=1 Tax=Uranotaenia lowii TaxID=190385 RepID=UPI0024783BF9|nr:zinc finger protein 691 [Uranotaenia lowii]